MKSFILNIPTKIFFGNDKKEDFFYQIKKIADSVLLIYGNNSAKKNGYYDNVLDSLKKNDIKIYEFHEIEPNPLCTTIDRCFNIHKKNKIDLVLGLGGGSVMDASKAISALLYLDYNGFTKNLPCEIWQYVLGSPFFGKLPGALPLAMIPTTAATASEVTPYSVISNKEIYGKSTLSYEFFKPTLSWINPEHTKLLPNNVTADGAADILSHVFENYLLGGNDAAFTDRYCESIIKTVLETLPKIFSNPLATNHRSEMLWCSTLALNGMQSCGRDPSTFPLHAIEHSMSAISHKLAHGRGLATLFPAYFKWLWNKNRARDRLNKLAFEVFNINNNSGISGLLFIEKFESWLKQNGLYQSSKNLGFCEQDYLRIANYTISTYGDGDSLDILGRTSASDIIEILKLTEDQKEA